MLTEKGMEILNSLPTLACVSDGRSNCLFVNKNWREFTGLSLEEAKGSGWKQAVHEEDLAKLENLPSDLGKFEYEFRLRRAGGEYIWMVCFVNEEDGIYTKIIIDISEKIARQRQAEEKSKRTTEFLTSVLDGIPDPIFVKDKDHLWVEGNKAWVEMFGGLAKEELLDKSDYDFFPKAEADVFWKKDDEVFASEDVVDNFETFTHNNETLTFFTRKVVVTNPEGEKILVGAIRDITELEKVKDRLEKAVEGLSESNEELERFAYVASHDLQEPLRTVVNFTGLLQRRYGDRLDDSARQYIKFASDAAHHMEELVDDLLEYARFEEEPIRGSEVNCVDVLEYVKDNLRESIRENKAVVVCKTNLPILSNSYPVRLSRLLQNIISNGIKYCSQDVVPRIEVSCEETVSEDGAEFWKFAVSDNGIGIGEEYYQRIFNPFKRLHTSDEYSGTGIGLAICKKIMTIMGGDIWVESELDKGSTFYFTIPKLAEDRLSI